MEHKKHNPGRSLGIFLVVLGLFLGGVFLDILNLGNPRDYFVWPMLVLFIGILVLLNGSVAGGFVISAVGFFFLLPRIHYDLPYLYDKVYWPAVIVIAGLVMIISGIIKRYGS